MVSFAKYFVGKTSEKIDKTQWKHWYDSIIPDGSWDLLEIEDGDKEAIQVYKKDNEIVVFQFTNIKNEFGTYGYSELSSVTRWYDRKI